MKSAESLIGLLRSGLPLAEAIAAASTFHPHSFSLPCEINKATLRSWRMVPVLSRSKDVSPAEMIGYPTSDRVQLRQWVAEHPGCNFAIAAGAEWGLIVLEVAGRRSMASLRALCGDDWTWRDSCEFHAGNAQFFIFAHPGQGTRLIDPCLAGVTLHEGLVMAPPSRLHTGEVFAYTRPDAPLLSVPAWLLDQDDNQR